MPAIRQKDPESLEEDKAKSNGLIEIEESRELLVDPAAETGLSHLEEDEDWKAWGHQWM